MQDLQNALLMLFEVIQLIRIDYSATVWILPLVVLFELPLFALIILGITKYSYKESKQLNITKSPMYLPSISCIVTCYSEGDVIKQTARSLFNQIYAGHIEIILVIDGAVANRDTYNAAIDVQKELSSSNRNIVVLPKWQRGGRVSSCNAGLDAAQGEIVMALDGDSSFDNTMVASLAPHFQDPSVPATSGPLRARNLKDSVVAKLQSIEYLLSMQGSKTGLSEWNLQTNISGAFGAFRTSVLRQIGGWSTHSAEDLDLTIRLKQYQKRQRNWRIPFEPKAIGHTDVPHTLKDLIKQRLRWDGDLFFIFFRKHWQSFSPTLVGKRHFFFTLLYGWVQNVVLPFVIVGYSIFIFFAYPPPLVLMILLAMYLLYLTILVFFFLIVVTALSERVKEDIKLIPFLLIFPFYALFMRFIAVLAILNEIFRRSHEESAMAPWWVFRKGGKF